MLGTSHTSNKTESLYENQRKEEALVHINTKFNKKTESYRPSAISNSDNLDELQVEEKKLPMKPKPVKKGPVSSTFSEPQKEESADLVIHSREYQNKNSF